MLEYLPTLSRIEIAPTRLGATLRAFLRSARPSPFLRFARLGRISLVTGARYPTHSVDKTTFSLRIEL